MSSILVVFGATGQQGGSVIDYVLADPILSKRFTLRAITRNINSCRAKAIKEKDVEVVEADADDLLSLKSALRNAHTIFANTITDYDHPDLEAHELKQGKMIADAAVDAGAQYIIYSTLAHAGKISGGKLKNMGHFDTKAEVEAYIRSLSPKIKSAFFAPGSFMQNWHQHGMGPRAVGDGTYALINFVNPDTRLALIDIVDDTGKYVGAILAEPEKYEGKTMSAATGFWSYREIVDEMSRASGKTVIYNQQPQNDWARFLPPKAASYLVDMFLWFQDYGYWGPSSNEDVEWTIQQARGKLTTLEEYLKKHPLSLG
ncbi:MAG: hypothetical protein Q9191_000372 [Dirinaria sp. TL-2023a]